MQLGKWIKVMGFLTVMALCYLHMQMKIYALAYQAKIKEQVLQKLATIQTAALPPGMGPNPLEVQAQQGMPTQAPMALPPGPIGTPGAPPMGPVGGPPINPVPSPGQGMPLVPGMPPGAAGVRVGPGPGSGGVAGMPQVPMPGPPVPF